MKSSCFSVLIVLFLFCFLAPEKLQAQKPVLERSISLKFSNERTDAVLNKIALLGKFNFSYNPALIDVSKPVSGNFVNKPVREVLNDIFDGKIDYKEKGGYLILQKGKEKEIKTEPKEWITFSGYVRDEKGDAIPFASVYDKASLESTVSNEYGFYRIRFYLKQVPLTLFFSKAGYVDTTVFFSAKTSAFVNVILKKPVTPKPVRPDEKDISAAAEETAGSFFKNLESGTNSVNISDTLYRKIQGSLLPYIGSNGKLGGNVINDYSFNVFGGYSLGVKKLELAGFFNLTRGDMEYVQLAGFANLNGGTVKGVQMAGFANLVKDEVRAAQFAGLANVDWNNFEGAQFAGLVNTVKGKTDGVQIAGLVNTSLDTVKGFQAAGICNVAYRSMKGTQVAGICNSSLDTLSGTQISLVNFARHINGSQLGFLNVSKSTTGVPVGFLSYVHVGYHKFEISADEIMPLNISLRTGVTSFHNILTSGLKPGSGDSLIWSFGYGVGTSAKLSKRAFLDFDITASQIVEGNNFDKLNLLAKAYVGIDKRLNKFISLAMGVTLNGQITKTDYNNYPDIFTYYEPNIFSTTTWELDKTQLQMWLGAKVALRFF